MTTEQTMGLPPDAPHVQCRARAGSLSRLTVTGKCRAPAVCECECDCKLPSKAVSTSRAVDLRESVYNDNLSEVNSRDMFFFFDETRHVFADKREDCRHLQHISTIKCHIIQVHKHDTVYPNGVVG